MRSSVCRTMCSASSLPQRFHTRSIEHPALVLNLRALHSLRHFLDLAHALGQHVGKTKYATMSLHDAPHLIGDFVHSLATLLAIKTRQTRRGAVGSVLGQILVAGIFLQEPDHRIAGSLAKHQKIGQ